LSIFIEPFKGWMVINNTATVKTNYGTRTSIGAVEGRLLMEQLILGHAAQADIHLCDRE